MYPRAAPHLSIHDGLVSSFGRRTGSGGFFCFTDRGLHGCHFNEPGGVAFLGNDQHPFAVSADDVDLGVATDVGDGPKALPWPGADLGILVRYIETSLFVEIG